MGHHHGHSHGVSADADSRRLAIALALIVGFMCVEVVAGILAGSLALLSDAAHMLTDAGALALALVAIRLARRPAAGAMTYGLGRSEIVAAAINGSTLLILGLLFVYESVRRLIDPHPVEGGVVLIVAIVGVAVNLVATSVLAGANRESLNVEGAFQHILTDLAAFVATAIAGAVILLTGFERADGIAALFVAALMLRAAYYLLRESGRVFLEAAPRGLDPRGDRPPHGFAGGRDRGPRPAHLGGHVGLPVAVGARPRRPRGRLPRRPPLARADPARRVRDRSHDPAGRPRGRRPAGDRGQPAGITQPAIATKWVTAAATTSAWKISWKPNVAGQGSAGAARRSTAPAE